MTVVTVFLSILKQIKFHLVQNLKENCHHDHIPFNVKGIGNTVFSVRANTLLRLCKLTLQKESTSLYLDVGILTGKLQRLDVRVAVCETIIV